MQTTQNAYIQRVMNLVDLYRTKVGKESQIAKEAKADDVWWNQENLRLALEARETGEVFCRDAKQVTFRCDPQHSC